MDLGRGYAGKLSLDVADTERVVARHKKTAIQTVFFKKRYLVSSTSQPTTWFKFFAARDGAFNKASLISR